MQCRPCAPPIRTVQLYAHAVWSTAAQYNAYISLGGAHSTCSVKYLDKFEQTADWAYTHLCDKVHGEWWGYADRDGTVTHTFKGGPYKGCFHVPRSLFMCIRLLEDALARQTAAPHAPETK